jgi:hypothetical protein
MSYNFIDSELTVYSANTIPLDQIQAVYCLDIKCKTDYLVGIDNEKRNTIVFFVDRIPYEDNQLAWTSSTVKVYYYIDLDHDSLQFDRLNFRFPELNYFYSINHGIRRQVNVKDSSVSVSTLPFEKTERKFNFSFEKKEIICSIGVLSTFYGLSKSPIILESTLICKFEQTDSVDFLISIYNIILNLFFFLCYRKNISIETIQISGLNSKGERITVGYLHFITDQSVDAETEKTMMRTVEYRLFQRNLSELMQLIANDRLYTQHIPETKSDSNRITPAKFILITAAFEWNANDFFKIPLSPKREQVKSDVLESIRKIPVEKGYNRSLKDKLKFYVSLVSNIEVNLSEKIVFALRELKQILDPFIQSLYKLNGLSVDTYEKMGDRIQAQRNGYAHGDMSKEFDSMVILDIIILEWVNYGIVLKSVGYNDDDIFNIINSIFSRHFMEK